MKVLSIVCGAGYRGAVSLLAGIVASAGELPLALRLTVSLRVFGGDGGYAACPSPSSHAISCRRRTSSLDPGSFTTPGNAPSLTNRYATLREIPAIRAASGTT